ncbi:hypothetical protein M885DRAFT_525765 [Pelagophyceae sp. CCMP2097]|nr:hypothetical protein M885DRAFT_525765 [Pelagophyceae sp. CCMP2097]
MRRLPSSVEERRLRIVQERPRRALADAEKRTPFEVAIVTAILRTQQKVQLVAFQPTAENPFFPLNMSKSDLDAYDVRHPSHRRSNDFTDMALCRKCECVFRVRNGRVSAQMRRELGGELQTLESDVLEASRHKKTLMEKTPNAFGAILEANRAVGDFEAKVACAKTRLEKPQVWCPGCLNTDFPLN